MQTLRAEGEIVIQDAKLGIGDGFGKDLCPKCHSATMTRIETGHAEGRVWKSEGFKYYCICGRERFGIEAE